MNGLRERISGMLQRHARIFRFLIAGGFNTAVGLAIYPLLLWSFEILHKHYMIALGIAQVLGVSSAFVVYKLFVFRTKTSPFREFRVFSSFYLANYAAAWISLPLLVEVVGIRPVVAQLMFAVALIIGSYFWHSKRTFRPDPEPPMTDPAHILRDCPGCGAAAPPGDVASEPRAETMTLDALRPYWSGLFKEKVFFSYGHCTNCGLLFAPTFFSQPNLEELYSAMAPNMSMLPVDAIEATQRGYFDAVDDGGAGGSYLEIGPDVGHIVRLAADRGKFDRFWLFEPNGLVHEELAEATRGHPHVITTDMDDLSAVPDGSVGLAVIVQVLDHLLDPMQMLSQVHAKLRPDGQLLIVTHNEASLLRSIMGRRWPPFCLQHPQIYSPASMRHLITRAGFSAVTIGRCRNYFPISFMARQAAWTVGIKIDRLPLPTTSIGLKLGNMITVARR